MVSQSTKMRTTENGWALVHELMAREVADENEADQGNRSNSFLNKVEADPMSHVADRHFSRSTAQVDQAILQDLWGVSDQLRLETAR
jgi:hypothetical protein